MENYFTVYNRSSLPGRVEISKIRTSKEEIVKDDKKFKNIEINRDVKNIISPSKTLYSEYPQVSNELINYGLINMYFGIINSKPIYNNKGINIYSEDNVFINKRIEQGIDISYSSLEEADIVFFNTDIDKFKEGANLLLHMNIIKNLDMLIEITKHFNYISVYRPERQFDNKGNKVYIYLYEYEKNNNNINTRDYFITSHNKYLLDKIDRYVRCIKMMLDRNYGSEEQFNFISCEKILNLY